MVLRTEPESVDEEIVVSKSTFFIAILDDVAQIIKETVKNYEEEKALIKKIYELDSSNRKRILQTLQNVTNSELKDGE
jgi:hypothetical protein